ncbi:MAG: hypothetical protein SAJ12_24335 [Jaaginema sp. PMC 1079.18]|nr:hypothetical protein [Jaaginema sp. PMC 1080.18]MEC4854123.1 hypothetical protein [Jaaginema sp. PMC 1079.18]MEC4865843.1 hypothetical protein [Jaaginema sp. PMC 1078.18]
MRYASLTAPYLTQLTLAQVFDALSFYLDNQAEINEYIERNHVPENLIHPAVRIFSVQSSVISHQWRIY